ncbi:yippee-like protein [Cristinia sonorae]|uniref:Protein yippee-like n=1 Tax=Cristinia sonorae TaxID=1940300 RepID=A0A8K0XPZ8_9AGAR|nr:yippee-like protein [Cristinia sonorae]
MGMSYRRYLTGARIYGCSTCRTHLATIHSMMSRAFNGQHGRAYLFDGVVNVIEGEPNDRQMTTGNHTVRDIYCIKCGTTLGWKYVRMTSYPSEHPNAKVVHGGYLSSFDQDRAYEPSQKYKEGKFILERNLLVDVQ